jgi:hypothetical protein
MSHDHRLAGGLMVIEADTRRRPIVQTRGRSRRTLRGTRWNVSGGFVI